MLHRPHNPVLLSTLLAILPASLVAQANPAPQVSCSSDPKAANACPPSQQFPYPGESKPAAPPAAPAGQGSAGQKFPYPGDHAPSDSSSSASSSSSSPDSTSSSSSSSSSSSNPNDPDDPLDIPTPSPSTGNVVRRKLPKPTHLQTDDEREAEDVKVAKFYSDSGNYVGAYARLKDATKLISDDPDAFYLLGGVATHLGKANEAADAYGKFLALEPDTRRAKAVRRDLSQTQAKK